MNIGWHTLILNKNHKINIEEKLFEIDEYINGNLEKFNRGGLLTGLSGICLQKYYMYLHFKDKTYLDDIESIINKVYDNLNTLSDINCSYADGLSGIGLALDFLSKKKVIKINTNDIKKQFNPYILNEFETCLKYKNFDFLYGAMGHGLYINTIFSSKPSAKNITTLCDVFTEFSKIDKRGRRIEKPESYFEQEFVGTNIGLAHGLASYVSLLNLWKTKVSGNKNIDQYLTEFIDFIYNSRNKQPNCFSVFPAYTSETTKLQNTNTALSWCYGDLGIAITLLRIGVESHQLSLQKKAIETLKHSAKRVPVNYDYVTDPYFCHGSAGIVHIFNKAYYYSQDKLFYDRAEFWLSYLLNQLDTKNYIKYEVDENPAIELLNGITGTSLVLLSTISNTTPEWDSFFLLS